MTERSTSAPAEPASSASPDVATSDTMPSPAPVPEDTPLYLEGKAHPPNNSTLPMLGPLPGTETLSLDTLPEAERSRLQLLVRGGTTSSAYDKEMQQRIADANLRRAEADADRKIAQIPVERGGGMLFENKLADPMTGPRVLIKYVGKTRDVLMEQLCELVEDKLTGDHMLIFVCPECFARGVPSGFAQCHARSKHRQWHLDLKEAGTIKSVRNSDMPNGLEFYTHAGSIMDTDVLRCDGTNCGAAFKIHNNVMYRV